MTTTIVGILIVVLWLFVLMPFLLRKHKPISKVGEGFDDTRVIHEGGHKPQRPPALRPKVAAADAQQRKLIADQPEFGVEDTPTVPFKKITSPLISDKPKSANDTVAMAAASNQGFEDWCAGANPRSGEIEDGHGCVTHIGYVRDVQRWSACPYCDYPGQERAHCGRSGQGRSR